MSTPPASSRTTRRRFAFYVGLGLFTLGERLHAGGLDSLASAAMRAIDGEPTGKLPEHWTVGENNTWRWYERENLIDGQWRVTGITTPVHKLTGEYHHAAGYLEESRVPASLRVTSPLGVAGDHLVDDRAHDEPAADAPLEHDFGKPSSARRARHGRPPSRWLRSLRADELQLWLKTIDVPEAGVEGMTYWMHLTRDHAFDPAKIEGLDEDDLAKLHAAAHYGY